MFIAKVREFEAESSGTKKPADASQDERTTMVKTAITKAVQWCIANNVLKDFFEQNGSEVINMLFDEWKLEDALVVEREEGREERDAEIVENALREGASVEFIQKITGLPAEIIRNLTNR
jgi:hypothetical protein